MKYHEAADFLFELRRYPSRKGLEATRAFLDELGDPHEGLSCVQIAGSNGKGSTARMLEMTLREAGLDVGLYTSPHLTDVRERVRVNGRKITKAAVCEFVEETRDLVFDAASDGEAPTFFETTTVLALWEFARQDVDVAVLEVGIGGRYDATSVVDPVASAVTSVSLEHTEMLGDTVAEIARDKAQVVGEHPIVTAADGSALEAIRDVAGDVVTVGPWGSGAAVECRYDGREELEAHIALRGELGERGARGERGDASAGGGSDAGDWAWSVETPIPVLGAHQAANAGVAAALARQVADVDEGTLVRGLQGAYWPGRIEVMGLEPLTILDGAHNPGGCRGLARTLEEFAYDELHLVFGAMSDKDHPEMVSALPDADHVYTCRANLERAETPETLARAFAGHTDRPENVHRSGNVPGAVTAALDAAGPNDCVLVAGSLYLVAEARERWVRAAVPKRVDSLAESRAVLSDAGVTAPGVWRMRAKGVHRVVKTRVQPRQAEYVKQEMLSLGGECAVSGLSTHDQEFVDVVLMGTMAQHRRLYEKLDGQPWGLTQLGRDLRESLGIQFERERHGYPWEDGTAVMGVLNVTPDSFHDGGEYDTVEAATERAERMVDAGVSILDVGGESTRPGADPVSVEEEKERILPVIEALADLDAMLSVDTRKAAVADAAVEAGADIVNDVSGLDDPAMRQVIAEHDVPTVVMHSIEAPVDPDTAVEYDDVVEDVLDQLTERVLLAEKAGLDRSKILVDPGLGFGKSKAENFELLDRLGELKALGCPVLVGHSHKSMFTLVGEDAGDAPAGTIAGTALAADRGADVVRVHDAHENVVAVRTARALRDPDRLA